MSTRSNRNSAPTLPAPVAGNGLLDRRAFLAGGAFVAIGGPAAAAAIGDAAPEWTTMPGATFSTYGSPALQEAEVGRAILLPWGEMAAGSGVSFTPLNLLRGTITPNGLHFERHHNGVPAIDPERHELLIHGLVRRPLKFTMESLLRYPMVSRQCFVECAGNSFFNTFPEPYQGSANMIHGLASCSEWTGVAVATLLDEVGVDPGAAWCLAESADAAAMSRSIPLAKLADDAMIALYQNGERIRPEQGYPLRLLLPGWEGSAHVKWLRRMKLTAGPLQTRQETSKYTDTLPDGRSRQFTFTMDVKSVITQPSPGLSMAGPGLYEVSGLAWSGHGRIARVEVSTDGGASWALAALQEPVLAKCFTRFRIPWRWNGGPARMMSRAFDEHGNTQPSRDEWVATYSPGTLYHCNFIQVWDIAGDGSISNVYV
jgi:sulfane dehydrogenase subunit SoxC